MTTGGHEATDARARRRRFGRRAADELICLELPDGRPARSPAAWLHAMLAGPLAGADEQPRYLAEHIAGRAVRRGARWVVVLGDHTRRRRFRRLDAVDLAELACAPDRSLLTFADAAALIADGVPPARIQPIADPSPDCSIEGVAVAVEALEYLATLGYAAVIHDGSCVTGVVGFPNTRA